MLGERYYFWLGSELGARRQADRTTHERSQSTLSPPVGGYPSRGDIRRAADFIDCTNGGDCLEGHEANRIATTLRDVAAVLDLVVGLTCRPSPSEWR
jgi:hypothetical protein